MTTLAIVPGTGTGHGLSAMAGVDRVIRVSTAIAVLAVAGVAAYVSYWHAYAVVCAHGETGITARLEPATIDGLVYASSMVNLYAARHRLPVPTLARWLLALGIVATLAANMAQGWSHGPVGAVIAAWPAASLVGSYELLVWIVRTAAAGEPVRGPASDNPDTAADHPWCSTWSVAGQAPEAGPGSEDEQAKGLAAVAEDAPEARVRADQRPGPHLNQADHLDQSAGHPAAAAVRIHGEPALADPGGEDHDVAAAVDAYRISIRVGAPLSERKLGDMFGRSRRWARSRMAEARHSPAQA